MRPVLALVLLVLGALFLAVLPVAHVPTTRMSSAAITPTAETANAQIAPPPATPDASPIARVGFADRINNAKEPIEALNSLLLEGVKFGAIFIGTIIVVLVIRAVRVRPTELVVPDLANASRDVGLNDLMDGLSHEMRGRILEEMKSLREFIQNNSTRVGPDEVKLPRTPLPTELPDAGIKNMIDAVADSVPGETKNIVQLVHAITPSRGVRVAISLVRSFEDGERPGILMEVADLGGRMIERRTVTEHAAPRLNPSRYVEFLINDDRIEPGAVSVPANVYVRVVGINVGSRARTLQIPSLSVNLAMAPGESQEAYARTPSGSFAYWANSLERGRAAISGVLTAETDPPHSLGERYAALARPAARWLAFRLTQWQLLDNPPLGLDLRITAFEHRRRAYVARMHNLLGAAKSAYGEKHPENGFLFEEAREHFRVAINVAPEWSQPHENLADTLMAWGRQTQQLGESPKRKFRAARRSYQVAMNLIDAQLAPLLRCRDHGRCRSQDIGYWLRPIEGEQLILELEVALRRTKVGAAIAGILLDDDRSKVAVEEMREFGKDPFILRTKDERLLYSLALLYGLASRVTSNQGDLMKAGRYLLSGLARDARRSYWRQMCEDEAFSTLEPALKVARDHLRRLLGDFPRLTFAAPPSMTKREAERGARGSVEQIKTGFTVFSDDGPLGRIVDRIAANESSGIELLYVARFSGERDELWIPTSAVGPVYPLTSSVFIAATSSAIDSWKWDAPPPHVSRVEDRRFHCLIEQVANNVGWI